MAWSIRVSSSAEMRRNPIGVTGLAIVCLVVLVASVGPVVWAVDYSDQSFRRLVPPSLANPMGTDNLGRDVLSRVIHGAQVSLQVAAVAVGVALAIGVLTGIVAALYGGKVDGALMRVVDIMF